MNAANSQQREKVAISHSALIGMRTLSDEERKQVMEGMSQIADLPPEKWPADRVFLRSAERSLYLLKPNEELYVLFRKEQDGILTIVNLIMRETLELYSSLPRSGQE